jgi:hypothetical protein
MPLKRLSESAMLVASVNIGQRTTSLMSKCKHTISLRYALIWGCRAAPQPRDTKIYWFDHTVRALPDSHELLVNCKAMGTASFHKPRPLTW